MKIQQVRLLNNEYTITEDGRVVHASKTKPLTVMPAGKNDPTPVVRATSNNVIRYFSVAHLLADSFRNELGYDDYNMFRCATNKTPTLADIEIYDAPNDWIRQQDKIKEYLENIRKFHWLWSDFMQETTKSIAVRGHQTLRPIKGYENYLISPEGFIVSRNPHRVLKESSNYLRDSSESTGFVRINKRQIIAETYIGKQPNDTTLVSLDGDLHNVDVSNLLYVNSLCKYYYKPPITLKNGEIAVSMQENSRNRKRLRAYE